MLIIPDLIANAAGESRSFADALPHLLGFVVVLTTLSALLGICILIGKLVQRLQPEPAASPKPAAAPAPKPAAVDNGPSPELVAVIAAATATVVGQSHRVISIKPQNSAWSASGRHQHQTSHNIR